MAKKSTRFPAPHFLVSSTAEGWLVCACGCGYVAVCRHCVPTAPSHIATCSCSTEKRRFQRGRSESSDEASYDKK
jgi:hypothetical protein